LVTRLPTSTASRPALLTALLTIYLVWGSTYLAIRFAVETIPPFLMIGARFAVAGALMYLFLRIRRPDNRPTARQWGNGFLMGGLMLSLGTGLVAFAEQTVPSGLAALLIATVPLFMVLLDWLWKGGERPSRRVVVGVIVGFVGVGFLVNPAEAFAGRGVDLIGVGAILIATLSWSVGSLQGRDADLPKDPFLSTAMQMFGGGAILVVASLLMGEARTFDPAAMTVKSFLSWSYLLVFGSFIAFSAYVYLMRNATAATVSTYAYVNPIVAVILGWWLGNEVVRPHMFVAMAILLGAVLMITRSKARFAGSRRTVECAPDEDRQPMPGRVPESEAIPAGVRGKVG